MYIEKMNIKGVAGIVDLEIIFNEGMNVICGPNGVGKTTILECAAHTFSVNRTPILKRNVNVKEGNIISIVNVDDKKETANIIIPEFHPEASWNIQGLYHYSNKLISLKTTRTFNYQSLDSISKDQKRDEHSNFEFAKSGINFNDVKNWFVNRYLYSKHEGALSESELINYELSKKCFSLLDSRFAFSKVKASSNEIMINTPSGEIYYEYLSAGFKSTLAVLFGIIKEIEYRFKETEITADSFDGIIIIDELEIHLHPEWQVRFYEALSSVFPKAQFIVSTHSPYIIQNALPNEIIALEFVNGNVSLRKFGHNPYGFKGWSVEEVLTDIMGMTDTRTLLYHKTLESFYAAIDKGKEEDALKYYKELILLLHPENHLKKLLRINLAQLGVIIND